jgi:RNA polymerase sigma factor (sigma-70 family)
VTAALERAYRDERAAVLATITRRLDGDLALAEDAVQDAFVAAAVEWDRRGVPDRPGAWLTTTAWRKALDRLRHARVAEAHAADMAPPVSYDADFDFERPSLDDDQLRMVFTCCHPALAPEARMALTLRSVAGLTVPEIARAFLSSETAMERRLTRARRKVTEAAIPFRIPPDDLLPERLAGVLRVVYLIYTEGHGSVRGDVCAEAIRLARLLARLMPDEAEVLGLLALLLVTDARRAARLDADGVLVALEDQDRGLWDRAAVAEGVAALERALRMGLRRRGRPRTGRRSPAFMPSSRGWTRRRSSRSTAPSRWRSPRAPAPASRSSTTWAPIRGSRATCRCTRRAPSCCAARATRRVPAPRTQRRSRSRTARPSVRRSSGAAIASRRRRRPRARRAAPAAARAQARARHTCGRSAPADDQAAERSAGRLADQNAASAWPSAVEGGPSAWYSRPSADQSARARSSPSVENTRPSMRRMSSA